MHVCSHLDTAGSCKVIFQQLWMLHCNRGCGAICTCSAGGTPAWVTQRLALGDLSSQSLLQPQGLATLGNYVFCTFYIYGSTGVLLWQAASLPQAILALHTKDVCVAGVCTTCPSETCLCDP